MSFASHLKVLPWVTMNPLGLLTSLPSTCYYISLLMAITLGVILIGHNMQCMNNHMQ